MYNEAKSLLHIGGETLFSSEPIYTVSFFGHRVISDFSSVEPKVEQLISTLLTHHQHVDFLVGRNGDFDLMVTAAIKRWQTQTHSDACSLIWILPYPTAELQAHLPDFKTYYDDIEVCQAAAHAHPKQAFQIRNREMVERSDLVVFYVTHSHGGAYQTLRYTQMKNRRLLNLGLCPYHR